MEISTEFSLNERIQRIENAHGRLFQTSNKEIEDLKRIVEKQRYEISYLKEVLNSIPDLDEIRELNNSIQHLMCFTLNQISTDVKNNMNSIKHINEKLQGIIPNNHAVNMELGNVYVKKITSIVKIDEWKGTNDILLFNYHISLDGHPDNFIATFNSNTKVKIGDTIRFTLDINGKIDNPKWRLKGPKVVQ